MDGLMGTKINPGTKEKHREVHIRLKPKKQVVEYSSSPKEKEVVNLHILNTGKECDQIPELSGEFSKNTHHLVQAEAKFSKKHI